MVSVRQALTMEKEEQEPAWFSDKPPPDDWPNRGSITFSSTSVLAGPEGPYLLRDINVHIKSKEKVSPFHNVVPRIQILRSPLG